MRLLPVLIALTILITTAACSSGGKRVVSPIPDSIRSDYYLRSVDVRQVASAGIKEEMSGSIQRILDQRRLRPAARKAFDTFRENKGKPDDSVAELYFKWIITEEMFRGLRPRFVGEKPLDIDVSVWKLGILTRIRNDIVLSQESQVIFSVQLRDGETDAPLIFIKRVRSVRDLKDGAGTERSGVPGELAIRHAAQTIAGAIVPILAQPGTMDEAGAKRILVLPPLKPKLN